MLEHKGYIAGKTLLVLTTVRPPHKCQKYFISQKWAALQTWKCHGLSQIHTKFKTNKEHLYHRPAFHIFMAKDRA